MEVATRFIVPVTETSQVGEARRTAARLATSMGFDETGAGKIAIIATELATNLVKHTAAGGDLIIQSAHRQGNVGLEIVSLNKGSGSSYTSTWLRDGFSTTGTSGTGLGAVQRLSNAFDIYSDSQHGTAIFSSLLSESEVKSHFDVGAVVAPKSSELVCGDSWSTVEDGRRISVVIADGLGHGIEASEASTKAIEIFRTLAFEDSTYLLERMHRGLKGTRGAAVSIITIDQVTNELCFSGLGNVVGVVDYGDSRRHLVPDSGTVGYEMRKPRQHKMNWSKNASVTLHSDGCSSNWNLNTYPELKTRCAALISAVIYRDFSRTYDDVTVVSIKNV